MKIICIESNYFDHEGQSGSTNNEPVFFLKSANCLLRNNFPFFIPDFTSELFCETELVIRICKLGKTIQEKFAGNYYNAIGIGIDFTANDILKDCKSKGLPWEIAKSFDYSAAISDFISIDEFPDRNDIRFHLNINGTTIQSGISSEMASNFEKIISYVSKFMTLKTGDLIFTGTPSGAGPVQINDRLEAFIQHRKMLDFRIK